MLKRSKSDANLVTSVNRLTAKTTGPQLRLAPEGDASATRSSSRSASFVMGNRIKITHTGVPQRGPAGCSSEGRARPTTASFIHRLNRFMSSQRFEDIKRRIDTHKKASNADRGASRKLLWHAWRGLRRRLIRPTTAREPTGSARIPQLSLDTVIVSAEYVQLLLTWKILLVPNVHCKRVLTSIPYRIQFQVVSYLPQRNRQILFSLWTKSEK